MDHIELMVKKKKKFKALCKLSVNYSSQCKKTTQDLCICKHSDKNFDFQLCY